MSSRQANSIPPWTVLRENGKLVVLYGLGAVVVGLLWWPLALVYLGYCLLSILLFVALICPYCCCYNTKSCPNAYHLLAISKPKKGRRFADQFRRYIFVTFPAWAIPPIAGLYQLFTDFSWLLVAFVAAFGVFGFVVFPYISRDVCATCKNARNCPRHKGRFVALGHEGSQDAAEKVPMKTRLRRLIAPPVFEGDEEKTRVASLLNAILFIVFGLVVIYTGVTLITDLNLIGLAVEGALILTSLGLLLLMRRGYVRLASWILSLLLWGLISVGTYYYGGLLGSGVGSFFGIVLIAGLLLGGRSALLFAGLSVLSTAVMLATETLGVAPPTPEFVTPTYRWAEFSTTVVGVASLFYLVIRSLEGALERARRNEREAIEAISRILKIRGRVLAVTWDHAHLHAELCDGAVVVGEGNIDVPKHDPSIPIKRVYLQPQAQANPDAVEAIVESDFVVLAPGNLFTSTVPNLLVSGIPEALRETTAPLVYVMNLMTRHGETDGYTASRHVEQIARYSGRVPDAVLVHKGPIPFGGLVSKYEAEKSYPVRIDTDNLYKMGVKVVKARNIVPEAAFVRVRHDPIRTAKALGGLLGKLGAPGAKRRSPPLLRNHGD